MAVGPQQQPPLVPGQTDCVLIGAAFGEVEEDSALLGRAVRAAQLTQGLQNMTLRAINMSLPPDEDWVDITYKVDGTTHETRVAWRVFESGAEVTAPGTLPSLPSGVRAAAPDAAIVVLSG